MSLRNLVLASIVLFSLAFLVACGSSSSVHVVPPPNGGFSNSNLNGTYVFSVAGTDQSGAPYAMVGTITADGSGGNGNGHITAGTLDINDPAFTTQALPNQPINSSSIYTVGVDGRGRATLGTSTPFGTIILDFVLQDSSHGLVTEFDGNASGSGTLDAQTASVTPQGPYALSLAGSDSTGNSLAAAGNFTVGSGGTISSGSEDFNDNGFGHTGYALSGTVVSGPSSTPGTTLVSGLGSLIYDVYAIDASHLKFIEMDTTAILSGDAFSQTSTTIPAGTFAFTLAGIVGAAGPSDAGGFLVTDGNNILSTSTEDANEAGTTTGSAPLSPTGQYTCSAGRCVLSNMVSFLGGSSVVAYPFNISGNEGFFLLEIDDAGLMSGAAYQQTTTSAFASSQGYGLDLTGINGSGTTGTSVEVDDIAEFVSSSTACGSASGSVVSGIIDENFAPGGGPTYKMALCGNYQTPDSNGRGAISAAAGNNSNSTLNGGFNLIFYSVDGTTFPFMEEDSGQVAVGVFVLQNAQASSSEAAAKFHMFMPPTIRSRAALKKLVATPRPK